MGIVKRYHDFHRRRYFSYAIQIIFALLLVSSCGKKGPPTLTSYEKPAAPSLLGVSQGEDKIFLSWGYPADKEKAVSAFIVLRASDSGFEKIASLESKLRTFTDTDAKEGITYTYKVVSRNHRGILSADSNSVTAVVLTPPVPPENVSWSIAGDSLLLSWERSGKDFMYNVYKTFEKGEHATTPVNKLPLSETVFKDSLPLDRPVFYTLRSLVKKDTIAEGRASQEIIITPSDLVPGPPENVRYFAAPDKIYLYWKEPDAIWIRGFRIYRKFAAGEYVLIGESRIPSFLDRETPSVRRNYRITAVGPSREGPYAEINGVLFVPE